MSNPTTKRFIALYRAMQSDHPTAKAQYDSLSEELKLDFDIFVQNAGAVFLEIKADLDEAIEGLGDDFSDPDPRKWDKFDWISFETRVKGHNFEEILTKYAKGENNMHLIWKEIETRL